MGEDASLDQFVTDESDEQREESPVVESDAGATEEPPDPEAPADIEPATTTYAWSGEGSACDECDETVERRWQQDGGLVCIECKDWERA